MAGELSQASLPWRVTRLEGTVDQHSHEIGALQTSDATLTEKVAGLTTSTDALKGSVDKAIWALFGLAVTIAGSAAAAVFVLPHG